MAIPDAERPLRAILVFTLIPTIALTIPTSVLLHHFYFALIIIPCIISAVFAIALLHPSAKPTRWIIFFDTLLATTHLAMLIPYWIFLSQNGGRYWYRSTGVSILGTFGSFFPLIDFLIHTCLAVKPGYPMVLAYLTASFGTRTCPHCQREISTTDPRLLWDLTPGGSGRSSTHSKDAKIAYVEVPTDAPAEEGTETPRASMTDDETARLV